MVKGDSWLEQKELFQSIANTITATLNMATCIWGLDEEAQALRIAGAVGLRPAYVKEAILKLDEPSVTGEVLQTGQPLAVRNVLEDERWKYREEAENRGWKSVLCVPIKVAYRALGVLSIYTIVEREFNPSERELLERYAALIGTSLENVKQGEMLRRLSDISRSLLSMKDIPQSLDEALRQIASSARTVLRADMVDLYQYIEEATEFKLPPIVVGERKHSLVPTEIFSDDVIVKIVKEGEPQYFGKAQEAPLLSGDFEIEREGRLEQRFVFREEIESSAAIPLRAAGETVGVMFVNYRSPQWFEPDQREQIELFANQAAVAMYNARLFQQEHQRAEAMDLLRQVSVELSTALDVERVLDLIVAGAMRLTGMESGVIYLIDDTGQAVTRSFEHPKGLRHPPPRLSKKTGLAWHVIGTGEVLILPDVSKDERVNPAVLEKGVQSMVALPLELEGKVVGVLFLNDLQPHKFTKDEQLLLSTLADQAALAIRNARLFESEERRLETLTTLHSVGRSLVSELGLSQVLEVISQSAREVLEADIVTLYQYFKDKDRFETPPVMAGSFRDEKPMRHKIYPDDTGVRIVRDGESHFADDVWEAPLLSGPRTDGLDRPRFVEREGIKSSAGVLLKVDDEIVGVMFVNYRRPITFSPEVREGIEIFTNQAALAIRNARLFEQTKKQREERIEAIREMGFGITATTDLDEVLQGILQRTIRLLGEASYGSVRLLDEETGELILRASHGKVMEEDLRRLEPGEGVMGWVAEHKEPVVVPDVDEDKRYVRFLEGTKSEMVVPMLSGDKLIGVLNVEHPQINAFDEDDLRLLQAIASQAVIAIENAGLFRGVEERVAQLEQLQKVTTTISSGLAGLDDVLRSIVKSLSEILEGASCTIRLYDPEKNEFGKRVPYGPLKEPLNLPPRSGIGTSRYVIQTKRPLYINDTQAEPPEGQPGVREEIKALGVKSSACLPLLSDKKAIGLLFVHFTTPHRFSDNDKRILKLFSDQAVIAIENTRLFSSSQSMAAQLEKLHEVTASISEKRDLEEVLLAILNSINTILGEGTSSSMSLYDKTRDEFYQYRAAGPWREDLLKTPPRPDGTGKHVIKTGKPIYIENVHRPPRDHPNIRQESIDRGVKSFAALPLKRGEDIVGIVFANLPREFHFSPEIRRVLELFAHQAAIAIENAGLYQDLGRKIKELEALSTLGADLSTVPLE